MGVSDFHYLRFESQPLLELSQFLMLLSYVFPPLPFSNLCQPHIDLSQVPLRLEWLAMSLRWGRMRVMSFFLKKSKSLSGHLSIPLIYANSFTIFV